MTMAIQLPAPDNIAQQHSDQLLTLIKDKIAIAGGNITFAQYMQLCLYAPGLGYYSAGSHKLGAGGDFTTGPEISSLFSRTVAQHINDVFAQLTEPNLLEFGAGSGKMAVDILLELEHLNSLPNNYFIIEASADLRVRQQKQIATNIPHLSHVVQWLEQFPNDFIGVVVANEVCDAMPVHRLHFSTGHITEQAITLNSAGDLQWCDNEVLPAELLIRAKEIQQFIGQQDYVTEVNLQAEAWLSSVADSLVQGAVFIIDYGYSNTHYYHPQRTAGTLMCYYQQQGHDNPLILPGLQDITAHVDFTALAETAQNNHLDVAGFQTQADFLIAGGITELVSTNAAELKRLQQTTEIKRLTLPSEMGETFKVLTLTRQLEQLLPRIQLRDQRHRL